MKPYVIVILVCVAFIVALIIGIIAYLITRKITSEKKVKDLFLEILNEHKSPNNQFFKVKENNIPYDFYFENAQAKYYIKVIYNYNCYEISINNRYKWQYRKDVNDDELRFIPDIVDFVNLKVADDVKKVVKLCLIYPNARTLLYYMNESEINFVRPDEPLYGINFITYERLNSNHDFLEGR